MNLGVCELWMWHSSNGSIGRGWQPWLVLISNEASSGTSTCWSTFREYVLLQETSSFPLSICNGVSWLVYVWLQRPVWAEISSAKLSSRQVSACCNPALYCMRACPQLPNWGDWVGGRFWRLAGGNSKHGNGIQCHTKKSGMTENSLFNFCGIVFLPRQLERWISGPVAWGLWPIVWRHLCVSFSTRIHWAIWGS
jgi:hypothetical protein